MIKKWRKLARQSKLFIIANVMLYPVTAMMTYLTINSSAATEYRTGGIIMLWTIVIVTSLASIPTIRKIEARKKPG
jgi:hypothetical protein